MLVIEQTDNPAWFGSRQAAPPRKGRRYFHTFLTAKKSGQDIQPSNKLRPVFDDAQTVRRHLKYGVKFFMKRIIEPELMDEPEQAKAYADADFEQPHQRVIELFDIEFPGANITGDILDLGCGPGDITFRFAKRFPDSTITGVDGSAAMINLANKRKALEIGTTDTIRFIEGSIPGTPIPNVKYDLILSNSLLHHLHQPNVLWETILEYAAFGTKIFVVDLFRPESKKEARRIVNQYSGNEPDILKKDFYNSLLAAFTAAEVKQQLADTGLSELSIKVVSDRHLLVHGEKAR